MKRKVISLHLIFVLLAVALPVLAKSNPGVGAIKSSSRAVIIPKTAVRVAPHVFSLGLAQDPAGQLVEGYAILKYKQGPGKSLSTCGNGLCEAGENAKRCPADCGGSLSNSSSCYAFLASGAKWKTLEPYIVDPRNSRNLDETFVRANLALNVDKWESAAKFNILGDEISGFVDGADTISPDNKNEVYFGSIAEPGAIAVTIIWGIFGGPPKARELVEWDQVYDDVDFDWSSNSELGRMDWENIATHELGHSVGLADLYTSECSEQTMFGYADYGETKKRTLEIGDITGIGRLY